MIDEPGQVRRDQQPRAPLAREEVGVAVRLAGRGAGRG